MVLRILQAAGETEMGAVPEVREVAAVEGKIMKTKQIPKPSVKMKTVTRQMEHCLEVNCKGCYLKDNQHCVEFLMSDALWYLKQTLEKSEGGNGGKKKTGTDAAGVI